MLFHYFIIFLLAMSPFAELRGSIPLALSYYKMPLGIALLLSLAGNILIAFLLLLFLNYCLSYFIKLFPFLEKFFNKLFSKTRSRHDKKFKRWEAWALVIIVAIPLPLTGAWTGALASYVFGIPWKKSFTLISMGVLIAAFIVTFLTLKGISIFG